MVAILSVQKMMACSHAATQALEGWWKKAPLLKRPKK